MKFDVSKTWNGLAYCVKTKNSYVVINYKQLWFSKSEIIVFKSDNKGVVLDFKNPVFSAIYKGYDERYFYDAIKTYEYIEKKKKISKKKKTKKEDYVLSISGSDGEFKIDSSGSFTGTNVFIKEVTNEKN